MATLISLTDRLRLELGDHGINFSAKAVGDGSTDRYNLPVEQVEPLGLIVTDNTTTLTTPTNYTLDPRDGVIILASVLATGHTLVVKGVHYETFLTADLQTFINTAFTQHNWNRNPPVNYDPVGVGQVPLPGVEDYLIVLLAQIEALWAMATDSSQDIDVHSPDGVMIPAGQRFQQLMTLISAKQAEYLNLSQQLGVGLGRIEVFDLRRRSRSTNRLIPIYDEMEYDEVNNGFAPSQGLPGTMVIIRGRYFTGMTDLRFHNTSTTFTVVDDTTVTAVVPNGATTGPIVMFGPWGRTETSAQFRIEAPIATLAVGPMRRFPPIDEQTL